MNLRVRDFAIIEQQDVEFASGMTVLTGETGAGKSILVDALGLVLGERGNAGLVRHGAERAEFSAEFAVDSLVDVQAWLSEQSLDADGACLLRRTIGSDGRSRAFINGNAVTLQQLKCLGEMLVDIHGQQVHQSLTRKSVQLDLLDFFGDLMATRQTTRDAHKQWQALRTRLANLQRSEADITTRSDMLTFQVQELQALDLKNDEVGELRTERQRLVNHDRLASGVALALEKLAENESANANTLLAEASRSIDNLLTFDRELAAPVELLQLANIQLSEAENLLRRYLDTIDFDANRRDWVEERLDAIQTLSRKHRVEAIELPALLETLLAELDEISHAGQRSEELRVQTDKAAAQYQQHAQALSTARRNAAEKFAAAVCDTMSGLGMPDGVFDIRVTRLNDGAERATGIDDIEFLISANPGQPVQPLARIASGGELSRMSLAIQVVASQGSTIPTMVFDEVDSGVGGGVAEMVGRRLAEVARGRQVLCVTHLPQVASQADQHFRISKLTDGKSTRTSIAKLSHDERVEELARMLGGVEITRTTLAHAAEMLAAAG